MPTPAQRAVENFFFNVSDVYSAVNNLLQGKPGRAAEDTMRVAINSVLGIGGLIDIATPAGLPKYKEDFGQTLGAWRAAVQSRRRSLEAAPAAPVDAEPTEAKPAAGKPADAEQESPGLPVAARSVPPAVRFGR